VTAVVFSPDGKSVAIRSHSLGDTLQLFDIDSGSARWKHSSIWGFTDVTFSADGGLLSFGGNDKATILDAGDGHVLMRRGFWAPDQSSVQAFISPDGAWLTAVRGRKVRVYDVRSGAETLRFRLSAPCAGVRCSPDGTLIATLGNDGIDVLDAASGQLHATLQNVPAWTNQMQFGGCSHVLVTAGNSVIRVWDVASGTLTGLCDTAPDTTGSTWLTIGDGSARVALTSRADGTLRVWDVATGQERTRLPTPQRFRLGAVDSDASKLATSNGGKSVEIWSIADGPAAVPADAADHWCPRCGAG
jgi:WD40 repeat protein